VSSAAAPTNTTKPGSLMAPTTRWSTATLAWLTRCTTARIRHPFPGDGSNNALTLPAGKCAERSAPAATGALTLVGLLSVAGVIGDVIAA
jgi:hypothetical protein